MYPASTRRDIEARQEEKVKPCTISRRDFSIPGESRGDSVQGELDAPFVLWRELIVAQMSNRSTPVEIRPQVGEVVVRFDDTNRASVLL